MVLNDITLSVVNDLRGKHDTHVFTFHKKPIYHMSNSGWRRAREKAGLPQVRVHDLKHTFGRRLRAAGVSLEHIQDLVRHRLGRVSTHFSAAELTRLIEAANTVCSGEDKKRELVVLRRLSVSQAPQNSR